MNDIKDNDIKDNVTSRVTAPEYKAVLFDLDGTLADAAELHRRALNDALAEHGFTITDEEHVARYNGLPTKVKLRMLTEEKGLPEEKHAWINARKQRLTKVRIQNDIQPDPAKIALFQSLRQREVKIAVCSNAVRETVDLLLSRLGLLKLCHLVLSNEDVSNPKPDPEIYLKAAAGLGVDIKECVVVEDSPIGVKAAEAAQPGMIVVVDGPDDVSEILF